MRGEISPMLQPGLMMERPLLISGIIEHAAAQFGQTQIVSRETHRPVFHSMCSVGRMRYTYEK
jgi:hypothetical protein